MFKNKGRIMIIKHEHGVKAKDRVIMEKDDYDYLMAGMSLLENKQKEYDDLWKKNGLLNQENDRLHDDSN